ncbi:MAG: ACP S-malonyltransferase [Saprospiraceae bacterium]|nr:ACP S-malonyltransferase [Saprospiraceae bacterium]
MKGYVFPGQASQFEGMGSDLYAESSLAKSYFDDANNILGYKITDIMFSGSSEELKQTKITQPAVFLHSVIKVFMQGDDFAPDAVAGHSLGEFSALVANGVLSFEDGLKLVQKRAEAMQEACELNPSTMAAIVGLADNIVEEVCAEIKDELVVAANYNCPGQLVISGTIKGVEKAGELLKSAGATNVVMLQVGGAFHSPLMKSAEEKLATAIHNTTFSIPKCPIYQNFDAAKESDPEQIKQKLIKQLTAPVRWNQTLQNMIQDGVTEFIECGGTGKVIQGMIKRIDRKFPTSTL